MTLNQIAYFNEVCKYHNITKAADALHITQPTVSKSIIELEIELQTALLYRTRTSVIPTDDGQLFLEMTSEVLDLIETTTNLLNASAKKEKSVRIGLNPSLSMLLLPDVFPLLSQCYPNRRIEIVEAGVIAIKQFILDETVSFALSVFNNFHPDLEYFELFTTEAVLCVNKKNPLSKLEKVTAKDIADTPLVMTKEDSFFTAILRERFLQNGGVPNIIITSTQLNTLITCAEQNIGATILFREVAQRYGNLAILPFADPITMQIGGIWRKDSKKTDSIYQTLSFIKNAIETS